MTRKKGVIKKLITACALTFSVAIGGLGFSSLEPSSAWASMTDGTKTYGYSDMFTLSESAEITQPKVLGTDKYVANALHLSQFFLNGSVIKSDKPYNGEINATFTGDASLAFRFINEDYPDKKVAYSSTNFDGRGEFKFYITDATDPTNYFIIHYLTSDSLYDSWGNTVRSKIVVEYPTETGIMQYTKSITDFNQGFNNTSQTQNVLNFVWGGESGDELAISIEQGYFSTNFIPLVVFDGNKYLPKVNFPNGYKISFSSDWETGTDIAFKSILGKSFEPRTYDELWTAYEHKKGVFIDKNNDGTNDWDGSAWLRNEELTFTTNTEITLPETAVEVITYNGQVLTDDCKVRVPQYEVLDGKFATAWKYGNMVLHKGSIAHTTTLDTSIVRNEDNTANKANVSVTVNGTMHTYEFTVTDLDLPQLRIIGDSEIDGFTGKTIELPYAVFFNASGNPADNKIEVEASYLGNPVPVVNNTIVLTNMGRYEIRYTATNKANLATSVITTVLAINDIEAPTIEVDYRNEYVEVGEEVTIPDVPMARDNADGSVPITRKVFFGEEEIATTNNKFSADKAGKYIIRYTAIDEAENETTKTFEVVAFTADYKTNLISKSLVSVDGATVTPAKRTNATKSNYRTGLEISSLTPYEGQFNAVFEGSRELTFKFAGITTVADGRGDGKGDFYFKISNYDNPNDYFTVHYVDAYTGANKDSRMGVYVVYNGEKRYCDSNGIPMAGTVGKTDEWLTHNDILGFKSGNCRSNWYNRLILDWDKNGVLSVSINLEQALSEFGYDNVKAIAKFDGTKAVSANNGSFGLPKLDWDKYIISFGSDYEDASDGDKGSDIIFLGLRGETDFFAQRGIKGFIDKESFLYNNKIVKAGETIQVTKSEGVKKFYSIAQYPDFIIAINEIKPNITIPDAYGEHNTNITVAENSIAFKAIVSDEFEAPVIKLASNVLETTSIHKNGTVSISLVDVVATDGSVGQMKDSDLQIFIKKSNGEFIEYTTAFTFDEVGTYTVRYIAMDNAGNTAYVDRYIKVVDSFVPEIEVAGEIPTTAYLGESFVLPEGTVNGKISEIYVVVDGNLVEIQDNTVSFTKSSEYIITYYFNDVSGACIKVFKVKIIEDVIAPEVTVDIGNPYVLKDTIVKIPTAVVTDNADKNAVVSVTVTRAGINVEVTNNTFKATEYGAYSITYKVMDKAGNITLKNVSIYCVEVLPKISENPNMPNTPNAPNEPNSPNNGNAADNTGVSIGCAASMNAERILIVFWVVVVLAISRKKQKNL